MAHRDRTWILAPNTDFPPDGPLQLGTVLSNPKDAYSVIVHGPHPDPETVFKQTQVGYHSSERQDAGSQSSVLPRFLDAVLRSSYARSNEKSEDVKVQFDQFDTHQFFPSMEYVGTCLLSEEAMAWMRSHMFRQPLYLITGIKIVRGAKIRRGMTKDPVVGVEASASDMPVEMLSSPLSTTAVFGRSSATFREDFVFAYKLRKVMISEAKLLVGGAKVLVGDQTTKTSQHLDSPQPAQPSQIPTPADQDNLPANENAKRTYVIPGDEQNENELQVQDEDVDAEEIDRPLRILSLDGGGVRGISSLLLLEDIMEEIAREEERKVQAKAGRSGHADDVTGKPPNKTPTKLRPCDYFDLICGTSTGGLIAIMLGRLGFTVHECISQYRNMAKDIFSSKSTQPDVLYDARILEQSVEKALSDAKIPKDSMLSNVDLPVGCRTFVVATATLQNGAEPFLLRSYKATTEIPSPFRCTILQACRATSAAPSFFVPLEVDGTMFGEKTKLPNQQSQRTQDDASGDDENRLSLSDGGLTANNPTLEALLEIEKIPGWGRRLAAVVSIGTGKGMPPKLTRSQGFGYKLLGMVSKWQALRLDVAKYCADLVTDTEATHTKVLHGLQTLNLQSVYHRLNAPGVGEYEMEDWKNMPKMEELTRDYIASNLQHQKTKRALAEILPDPDFARVQMLNMRHGYSWVIPTTEPQFESRMRLPNLTESANGFTKLSKGLPSLDQPLAGANLATNGSVDDRENSKSPSASVKPRNVEVAKQIPIPWTWPLRNNWVPTIQSMIFYNYDHKTKSRWKHKGHKRNDQSVLADRRDEGESAVAVLEMMADTSFVSSRFVQQWNIKTHDIPEILQNKKILINGLEVHCKKFVHLSFRCAGFGMNTQRTWFRVLDTDEVEVVFGTDAFDRGAFGREHTSRDYTL